MEYFLEFENTNDPILIGTVSFETFWSDDGFDVLFKYMDNGIAIEEHAQIRDQMGNIISIENFISMLEKLKIRRQIT